MKPPLLGVIGGLGPQTGCAFVLSVNDKIKLMTGAQPWILLENLPVSKAAEASLISGGPSDEHLRLLESAAKRLGTAGADVLVIPCNTVHVFIDRIREVSGVPVLSIVEETAKEVVCCGFSVVGLLGSTTTVRSGMHEKELARYGIQILSPKEDDQEFISSCIIRIINRQVREDDLPKMVRIADSLRQRGAQAVLLACTDLPLICKSAGFPVPVIDTMEVLEDAAVRHLLSI